MAVPNPLRILPLLCALASAEIADTVHPDFELRAIALPAQYKTMGMGFLSDGTLALATTEAVGGGEVPEPSAEHKVLLIRGANPDSLPISLKEIANGWRQPSGLAVVDDHIYVADRDGFYALPENAPADPSRNRALVVKWPDAGHWNFGPYWHQWCFTPLYKDGRFYAPYSGSILTGGWSNVDATSPLSGAFLQWDLEGKLSAYAGGLRSPNGAALDPATGEMFVTDNQGSWLPSSTFLRMRPDRFYGHRQTPQDFDTAGALVGTHAPNFAESLPYEPPVAWLPHGTVRSSPSQPARIPSGAYAGDWAIGDVNNPGLVRVALDRVGDVVNGAVFWFTKGMGFSAVNRIVPGPDGALWIGTITTIAGNWPSGDKRPLYRLKPKAQSTAFDLRAVRSLADGLELEFTRPVEKDSVGPGHFAVRSWQYLRQREYGQGRQPDEVRDVAAAEVSRDGMRVHLSLPGLPADRVVYVKLSHLPSAEGKALWNDECWFTLNAPSDRVWKPDAVALRPAAAPAARVSLARRRSGLSVSLACAGPCAHAPFTAELFTPAGRRAASARASGGEAALALPSAAGAWLLRVRAPSLGNLDVTQRVAF
jgi:hypothetical protein